MTNKSIILTGSSKSGKTQLRHILNLHPETLCFGGTKLMTYQIFREFPKWFMKADHATKKHYIDVYKKLVSTRFYCYRERMRGSKIWSIWWYIDRLWIKYYFDKPSLIAHTHLGRLVEKVWLNKGIQQRSFRLRGNPSCLEGYTGLGYPDEGVRGIDLKQISKHYPVLDMMLDARNLDEACKIYGKFWNHVFSEFAYQDGKKYWVDESTNSGVYMGFWDTCFDNMRMIHVIRDGRDVAANRFLKYGDCPKRTLDRWASKIRKTLTAEKSINTGTVLHIRYEDLVNRTNEKLKEITDYLGINFDEDMLKYEIVQTHIGVYQKNLDTEFQRYAIEEYGDLFRQLGYVDDGVHAK
jgi:hypothetical protein